jgi:hypothetical protein
MIRRALKLPAPVDGIDVEPERVPAQDIGAFRGLRSIDSMAVQRVLPTRLPRS